MIRGLLPGWLPHLDCGRPTSVFLLALVSVTCAGETRRQEPAEAQPPAVDTSAMEAPVAARIEAARRAVLQEPGAAEPWGHLGEVFHAHGLYPPAVSCYTQASERSPDDYRWHYLAGLAQQKADLSAAVGFFEAAARLAPRNPSFHVHFGNLWMDLGDLAAAERQYRTALDQAPRSSHALHGLARVELLAGDLDAARELLETAAEIAPSHGEVHGLLSQVYHRQGEEEKARLAQLRARAHAETSRAEDPVFDAMEAEAVGSRAHERRGLWLARAGRWAEAEEEFRRVLEIRPGNVRDFSNLGGALARQGKHRQALEAYEEALRIKPGDAASLANLATTRMALGELHRAVELLEEALRTDPAHAGAHYNLGLVRSRQGRFGEAVERYREALRLNPALLPAYADLGAALAVQGRFAEAVEAWERSLAIEPRQASVLYNLSAVLARRGEHRRAIERLRQGLRVAPDSSRLSLLLAWELATAPQPDLRDGGEARRLAQRVLAAYPNEPGSLDLMGAALAETGDFAAAAQAARKALQLAQAAGRVQLAEDLRRRLAGYEERRPYRQTSVATGLDTAPPPRSSAQ